MNTSINGNQKKRGRPATGERSHIAARMSGEEIKKVDEWAAQHGVTRAEAIRQLVQLGLQTHDPTRS